MSQNQPGQHLLLLHLETFGCTYSVPTCTQPSLQSDSGSHESPQGWRKTGTQNMAHRKVSPPSGALHSMHMLKGLKLIAGKFESLNLFVVLDFTA